MIQSAVKYWTESLLQFTAGMSCFIDKYNESGREKKLTSFPMEELPVSIQPQSTIKLAFNLTWRPSRSRPVHGKWSALSGEEKNKLITTIARVKSLGRHQEGSDAIFVVGKKFVDLSQLEPLSEDTSIDELLSWRPIQSAPELQLDPNQEAVCRATRLKTVSERKGNVKIAERK